MRFEPRTLDYMTSPYTGLVRESWLEAGKYLLEGIFRNLKSMDDPVIVPRKETQVTYPHLNAPEQIQELQKKAERFEGLARSLFIAAFLIKEEPEIQMHGFGLKSYYKNQILRSCTPGDPLYVGSYKELAKEWNSTDPDRPFQQTVETAALVIGLAECREEIWNTYTPGEKQQIAGFLLEYAYAPTAPNNWKLFNMLDLAFLYREGYDIDEELMREHAQAMLNYYAGDGWYRDGHFFDYYSCWAFQLYCGYWNEWYGYEKEPYIAGCFEKNSNVLMNTYPDFFDRDGHTNMWGRSSIYRNASVSAFYGNLMMKHSTIRPGLARRIASGALMQFFGRDDFLWKGVPTLGFYRQFSPLVQSYSCAESPYWMGKAFLCLHFPADHPFWTRKEENGTWEELKPGQVKTTVLNAPGLCFTNHEENGATILRTAKVVPHKEGHPALENYMKLCYHTQYPWETAPRCVPEGSIKSMQYVLEYLPKKQILDANVVLWHGQKEDVLYRRQLFGYDFAGEMHWTPAIDLADTAVPGGILRTDRIRLPRKPVNITLGSYGFADNGTLIFREEERNAKAIILKGRDASGREKQMAMTIYDGWNSIEYLYSKNSNPDSERSIILYARTKREKKYGCEPAMLISQVITKEGWEDFAKEELFPIECIAYTSPENCGGCGPTVITLKNGREITVDFEGMDGNLQL